MDPDQGRKPLLHGRGALRVEDFCLNTGLDQSTVDELMRTGRLEGALVSEKGSTRVVAIFDDMLPSREKLAAMGLPVRDDYDPHALRYGGIECQTHGWRESVLYTRYDRHSHRDVPDRSVCWECSRAGVPPDSGNSTRIAPEKVQRWLRSHDVNGNWVESEGDG